ncbi:MAG: glycoside hydrolase family 38 C-terminal domain-containing protein, partial [Acholeplasmataceae bacterium]|nr:glycoside hydrolase family 38 C-terminal domain-containing protein [Acholeplasmataceae bacterium]
IDGAWRKYQDKDLNQDILISYGFGDGGGGVTREMLEMRRRMDRIPGLPNVKTTTINEYFDKLHQTVKQKNHLLSKWDGELYFEYHRGTYTTQAKVKKFNRMLECLYRQVELLSVNAYLIASNSFIYPKTSLDIGWKKMMTNQFHDIIPGSSITEVYEDAHRDYEKAYSIGKKALEDASNQLIEQSNHDLTVYNDASWMRSDIVFVPTKSMLSFYDNKLKIQSQKINDGYLIFVRDIQPLSFKQLTMKEENELTKTTVFKYSDLSLKTPYYQVLFDSSFRIESLFDIENDRFVSVEGHKMNELQIFEDKPLTYDAWNIDIFYQEKKTTVDKLVSSEVIENGPVVFILKNIYEYQDSIISQQIIFYANQRRIDF